MPQIKNNCEICKTYTFLEKHHINSKSLNGDNKKSNLCYICPNCHNLVHLGEIIIEGKFASTKGTILIHHKKNEKPLTDRTINCYIYKI